MPEHMGLETAAVAPVDSQPSTRRWSYRPELDGLRALSIAAVVAFHYEHRVRGGYLGVTVFFVLSAYLITGLLATERRNRGTVDLPAFYARRALRLYPALIVVVVVGLIVATIVGHPETSNQNLFIAAGASLVYVNDFAYALGHPSAWFDPTWSLGVEEQFYLAWPVLLIFALRRFSPASIGRACVAVGLATGVGYLAIRPALGFNWTYSSPIGWVMALTVGCGLWFLKPRVPRWLAGAAALVLLVLIFLAPSNEHVSSYQGPQQIAVIAAAILIAHLAVAESRLMRSRALVWTGRRSYGIYLIHIPVLLALLRGIPAGPRPLHNLVAIPLSVVLAALSYRYVEQPFLRLKRRFARTNGQADPTAAVLS
jgi:peptidoglycan/LPS O-acetylase OafA/YrhL